MLLRLSQPHASPPTVGWHMAKRVHLPNSMHLVFHQEPALAASGSDGRQGHETIRPILNPRILDSRAHGRRNGASVIRRYEMTKRLVIAAGGC